MSLISLNKASLRRPYTNTVSPRQLASLKELSLKYVSGREDIPSTLVNIEKGLKIKPVLLTIEEETTKEKTQVEVYLVNNRVAASDNVNNLVGFGPLQRLNFLASVKKENLSALTTDEEGLIPLDERSNLPLLI